MKKNHQDFSTEIVTTQDNSPHEDLKAATPTYVVTLDDAFHTLCDALEAHPAIQDNLGLLDRVHDIRVWFINGNREVPWQHMALMLPQVLGFPLVTDHRA